MTTEKKFLYLKDRIEEYSNAQVLLKIYLDLKECILETDFELPSYFKFDYVEEYDDEGGTQPHITSVSFYDSKEEYVEYEDDIYENFRESIMDITWGNEDFIYRNADSLLEIPNKNPISLDEIEIDLSKLS